MVGVELLDQHVTVCFTDDQAAVPEERHQVHRVDVLLLSGVNSAEGVQNNELVLLSKDFLLNLTFSEAHGLLRDDLGDKLLSLD